MPGSRNVGETMPAKRYFEFSEGSSNKFWEVWCQGAEVFTRYGKIGASGQLTVKQLGSPADAKKQHDKLVAEKTGKGYVEKGAKKPNGKSNGKADVAEAAPVEIPEGALRLEHPTSRKFWQIQNLGKQLVITTGAIGTAGKAEKKKFKDEWQASEEHRQQLADKKKQGYAFVYAGPQPKTPAKPAHDAQLEAQIAKDPSNDDNFAVYADWLLEQGDVRGELASLQIQAAARPKDRKLANAIDRLLTEYRAYFYGPLAVYVDPTAKKDGRDLAIEATWRAGFMDELELGAPGAWSDSKVPPVGNVAELVQQLPKMPSAKFVRSIVITRPVGDGEYHFGNAVEALVKAMPSLPALRRLELGRFTYEDSELSWSHHGPLGRLWAAAGKQLEYVKLRAGSMDLGKINLPECREFLIETGGLDRSCIKSIVAASWPKLERLSVWFGKDSYGCTCKIKDVAPLLDAKLPKLKHLGLKNCQFGNELFALLPKSKLLKQLETLDLSMSHITTDVLERDVLPHKAAFAHLASIDLSDCRLDKAGQKLAKQLGKNVDVGDQNQPGDWEGPDYRFASVGE